MDIQSKYPSESAVKKTEIVFPNDANPMGMLQGGRLIEWMDVAAAVCAQIHAGNISVTASIYEVEFLHPATVGDIITIEATITRAFNSSMEILARAFGRKVKDSTNKKVGEAFFLFVAINDQAKPILVPAVTPQTSEEIMLYEQALERKNRKSSARK